MLARHVGARVHVGDEAYHRHLLVDISWQCGHEIAVVIQVHILQTHPQKDGLEILGEFHLSGRRWGHVGQFVALRVELHEIQKSIRYCHNSVVIAGKDVRCTPTRLCDMQIYK